MPFHVVAYTANTFGAASFDMQPASDAIMSIQNNHYLPHVQLMQFGGWFGGVNLTSIKLVTPRSRQVVPPPMYPIQAVAIPPDRPHIFDRRGNPFMLNAVEEVSIQATLGGTANALTSAVLFWGTSMDAVPAGDVYTLHGTASTPVTALTWSQIAITWDQTLPAGTYAMIGSVHQSPNAIAHRWIFKDQMLRPGFLSVTSLQNISEPSLYFGGWGKFGQFNTFTFPVLEVLANGADGAHDVTMNIVRVA